MGIGWSKFRAAARPIAVVGIVGTFLTAVAVARSCYFAAGLERYAALLVGTAVAPTDPAVVFSVLGQREVSGRSCTILQGESGVNYPVGIALMASLRLPGVFREMPGADRRASSRCRWWSGPRSACWGAGPVVVYAAGPAAGRGPATRCGRWRVRWRCSARRRSRTDLGWGCFVAGILIGDARAPYKREIEHFHLRSRACPRSLPPRRRTDGRP